MKCSKYICIMMRSSNGIFFRGTGLLCGEFTGHRWIPRTKASEAELWCFLWSAPEPTIEQTVETPVIWDAIALIMTSLWWKSSGRHAWLAKKLYLERCDSPKLTRYLLLKFASIRRSTVWRNQRTWNQLNGPQISTQESYLDVKKP